MKKDKKEFLSLRNKIKKYNKILIGLLCIFIVYALIHSITIIDCNENFSKLGNSGVFTCSNVSNDLYTFLNDNYMIISVILLIVAAVVLILQKINLYKINQLDIELLSDEKVYKERHVILTLLLGFTGIHKFRTQNKPIGYIYLVNFIVFGISWIIKNFSGKTYSNYVIFRVAYEFGFLFILGIIVLNIIDAIASLISLKDDDGRIFA